MFIFTRNHIFPNTFLIVIVIKLFSIGNLSIISAIMLFYLFVSCISINHNTLYNYLKATLKQGWGQVQYLYLSTYLSVLDVLEYLVYGNVRVLVLVLVLDQKVLGTWQVIVKYYLLKSVKVANYLNTLLQLSLYLVPTTNSIVGFVASLAYNY